MANPWRSIVKTLKSLFRPTTFAGRTIALDVVLTGGTILLVWVAIGSALYSQYSFLIQDAEHDTINLSRVYAESITRTVSEIDHTILFLRNSYVHDPAHFDMVDWERENRANDHLTVQISIIDRHGKLLMNDLTATPDHINLADREHFRAFLDNNDDYLFISKPLTGRLSGKTTIQFARRIVDPNGAFGGVIVVSVEPASFVDFYHALNFGHGPAQLIGLDGIIRAQAPDLAAGLGRSVAGSKLMLLAAAERQGSFWSKGPQGGKFVTAFEKVSGYPLIVSFSLDQAQILTPLWARLPARIGVGLFFTVLISCAGAMILRDRLSLIKSRNGLLVSQEVIHTTLENISQGVIMVDADRKVPLINRRVIELLSLPEEFLRKNLTFDEIINWQLSSGEFDAPDEATTAFKQFVVSGGVETQQAMYERTRANGQVLEIRTHPLSSGGAVRTYTDITERKKSEAHIAYLAHHDGLSGLPNRRLFNSRLADAVNALKRGGDGFALLCLDLDRFKPVNDTYGHAVGDRLLVQVADRLRGAVRDKDVIARIGGDEFVILQRVANQPHAALMLADRLVTLLRRPYDIDGNEIVIGVSAGVALCPLHGSSPDQLQKNADLALYESKSLGRNTYRIYDPAMEPSRGETHSIERDLREAVGTGELQLRYQPIFAGPTGALLRFEALARWTHPVHGHVAPSDFIPLAERTGIIIELDRWALKIATAEAVRWPNHIRLAVNVSATAFNQPDLPEMLSEVLEETGLPPARLVLELAEAVFLEDKSCLLANMQALKALGIGLALNDFGAKHANLDYLQALPFDSLKIAKSIVQGLGRLPNAEAVVSMILLLGKTLRLNVVAEGVEDPAQLAWLKQAGCDEVQGFLLGAPVTPGDAEAMLQATANAG